MDSALAQAVLNFATSHGAHNAELAGHEYDLGKGKTLYFVKADWPDESILAPGKIRTYVVSLNANFDIRNSALLLWRSTRG